MMGPYGGEAPAFRYGVLATRVSRLLTRYLETGDLVDNADEIFEQAEGLMGEILEAQDALDETKEFAPGSCYSIAAYTCVLQLIVDNEGFGVESLGDIEDLFSAIQGVLRLFREQSLEEINEQKEAVKTSRRFFRQLAGLMRAEVSTVESRPKELLPAT